MYSIRKATSAVGQQGVWCDEKLCVIRNVRISVQEEKVCGTRRAASAV